MLPAELLTSKLGVYNVNLKSLQADKKYSVRSSDDTEHIRSLAASIRARPFEVNIRCVCFGTDLLNGKGELKVKMAEHGRLFVVGGTHQWQALLSLEDEQAELGIDLHSYPVTVYWKPKEDARFALRLGLEDNMKERATKQMNFLDILEAYHKQYHAYDKTKYTDTTIKTELGNQYAKLTKSKAKDPGQVFSPIYQIIKSSTKLFKLFKEAALAMKCNSIRALAATAGLDEGDKNSILKKAIGKKISEKTFMEMCQTMKEKKELLNRLAEKCNLRSQDALLQKHQFLNQAPILLELIALFKARPKKSSALPERLVQRFERYITSGLENDGLLLSVDLGDLTYQTGCLDLQFKPKIPKARYSLVAADLPYGVLKNEKWDVAWGAEEIKLMLQHVCSMVENDDFFFFCFIAPWQYDPLVERLKHHGLTQIDYGFWHKLNYTRNQNGLQNCAEMFVLARRSQISALSFRDEDGNQRSRSNVFEYNIPGSKAHPCEKPVKLYEHLLELTTKPGERVLDLLSGSGALQIAAIWSGRSCTSIDSDEKYVNAIKTRVSKFVAYLQAVEKEENVKNPEVGFVEQKAAPAASDEKDEEEKKKSPSPKPIVEKSGKKQAANAPEKQQRKRKSGEFRSFILSEYGIQLFGVNIIFSCLV